MAADDPDLDPNVLFGSAGSAAAPAAKDPRYKKYEMLVKMHMPPAQIKAKMQASDPDLDPGAIGL